MLKSLKRKFNSISKEKQDRIRTVACTALLTSAAIGSATLLKVGAVYGLTKAAALTSAFFFASAHVLSGKDGCHVDSKHKKLAGTTAIVTFLALSPLASYSTLKYGEEIKKGLQYVEKSCIEKWQNDENSFSRIAEDGKEYHEPKKVEKIANKKVRSNLLF